MGHRHLATRRAINVVVVVVVVGASVCLSVSLCVYFAKLMSNLTLS